MSTVFVLLAMAVFVVAGAFVVLVITRLRGTMRGRRWARAVDLLLDGRDRQTMLDEAPYEYGHAQGETGYRIYDTRIADGDRDDDGFRHMVSNPEEAENWILERYLGELSDLNRPHKT